MARSSEDQGLHDRNDVKVSIPVWQHLLLHELKVLTDRTISETVEQALAHEFERLAEDEDSPISEDELHGAVADVTAPCPAGESSA